MRRCQTCYGHPEGGAGDIGQTQVMTQLNRLGLPAVLSTDTAFQVGVDGTALADGNTHELSDAILVDGGKGVVR